MTTSEINWYGILVGIILRGLMWVGATVAAAMGFEAPPESTWEPVAAFLATLALAGGAIVISWIGRKKLAATIPDE